MITLNTNIKKRRLSPWRGRDIENDGVNTVQRSRYPHQFRDRSDDIVYTTEVGDDLVLLATRFFGDPFLWWVLMDRNAIDYPLDMEPGTVLIVPSRRTLQIELR